MDRKQKVNNEDIETDAQICPEENNCAPLSQISLHDESAPRAQPSSTDTSHACAYVSSTSLQPSLLSSKTSLVLEQTAKLMSPADSDEYLAYIPQMPDDLREENIDILIVYAPKDRKAAAGFKKHLTKDILFNASGQLRCPRIKLLDEIIHGSVDNLDLAFSKSLFIFLYVTKDFCEEPWTLLQGQACLTEAIHDPKKKWCVVPIHTTPKKNQRYKLPMMLNSLRAINYWSGNEDQFYIEGVRKLLESKIGLLLERESILDEARKTYFAENHETLIKNNSYKDKGLSGCRSHLSYGASASSSLQAYQASTSEDLSKPSEVCYTDGGICVTNINRYTSSPDACDNKALPDESLEAVRNRNEQTEVSENAAFDQNNDLHVTVRNTTHESSQQPDQTTHHLPSRSGEIQHQSVNQQASNRGPEWQRQTTPLRAQTSICAEHNNFSSSTSVARGDSHSIVVDGPGLQSSSFSVQENDAPYVHQQRQASTISTAASVQSTTSSTPASAQQHFHSGMATSVHPAASPFSTSGNYTHLPVNYIGTPPNYLFSPMYLGQIPRPLYAHYTYSPYFHPLQHIQVLPNNMQDLYNYTNPSHPGFYPNLMRSHSTVSGLAPSNSSTDTSIEGNAPESVRSDLSHSLSTGTLNAVGFVPGLSGPWFTSENLSEPHVSLQPWSVSELPNQQPRLISELPNQQPRLISGLPNQFPISAVLTHQQTDRVFASSTQQSQCHIPVSAGQESMTTHQFRTRPASSATGAQTLANSGQVLSAGPSSSGSCVIQHIHHHHHRKNITVASATNVLIGDRSSQNVNKNPVAVIPDNEEQSDNDEEDEAFGGLREPTSSSRESGHEARSDVQSRSQCNDEAMGITEFVSPLGSREPVERSELGFPVESDEKDQTCHKTL